MTLAVVTLAAGKGSRMKSDLPKVLHKLAGKPMLDHVLTAAQTLGEATQHVVIGHGAEEVRKAFPEAELKWAIQAEQKGTGHAVAQALPDIADDALVLVLYGDVPLIKPTTLSALVDAAQNALALLTVTLDDPTGYGRIVRNDEGAVQAIVEHKDATDAQRQIREVNTGIMALPARFLKAWLPKLSADNAQGEYYLTDVIAMSVSDNVPVTALHPASETEVEGVNDRRQLAALERVFQCQIADELMAQGVALADPSRIDVRGTLKVGRNVSIDVGCVFEGDVELGDDVQVGAYNVIRNSRIGQGVSIETFCHIEEAVVAQACSVGPYARLRPGADLADGARVGNFCEVKKSQIGKGSKVNHLTYIGDASIGEGANIGAGTITCNYDGVNKFRTEIGDGAFIGSNSALVAPVVIGDGATVAAGSTVTKDVGSEELAVARGKQRNIGGWKKPTKD